VLVPIKKKYSILTSILSGIAAFMPWWVTSACTISTEMCGLLDQQSEFLNRPCVLSAMSAEKMEMYAHRNNRFRLTLQGIERNVKTQPQTGACYPMS
jgi:hypothetical protein